MIITRQMGVSGCSSCVRQDTLSGATLRGLRGLGRVNALGALGDENSALMPIYGLISTAGMAASAYHGYKRNNSVGWAIGWGILGAIFPIITVPVALAQGYGKRKGR